MDVFGFNGRKEHHKFVPLRDVEEEFRPKTLSEETIQRPMQYHRVEGILNAIRHHRTRQSVFTFTVAIIGDERILVDGQHRLEALRRYVRELGDEDEKRDARELIQVHVREIEVDNHDEAVRLRDELGMAVPVDPVGTVHGVRCQNLFQNFLDNCLNKPSASTAPRYGNWSANFVSTVSQSGFFEKFTTADAMIREVMQLNEKIFELVVKQEQPGFLDFITDSDKNKYQGVTFKSFREKYQRRKPEQVMCLALVVRYGFMELILHKLSQRSGDYTTYLATVSRKPFRRFNFNDVPSKDVMRDTLTRFFGTPTVGEVQRKKCPVCQQIELDRDQASSYHFGHILSRSNGGSNIPSNLIPVCHRCNLDCRAENMLEYCQRKFGRGFVL